MGTINQSRLVALERQVGHKFPSELLALLSAREPISQGEVAFVTSDRSWDVRTSYGLDDGDARQQLDRLYGLVGDVLPPATLPVAADWGDNFYCLVLAGPDEGKVVYWDHEREPGDHRVEAVADSLPQFFANLIPHPDNEAA